MIYNRKDVYGATEPVPAHVPGPVPARANLDCTIRAAAAAMRTAENKIRMTEGEKMHIDDQEMSKKEFLRKLAVFTAGLYIMAAAIALMTYAKLGTSPISSVPYVFSLKFTWISLGTYTMGWNLLHIAAQALVLRRQFRLFQLWQIPLSVAFGVFVDFNKYIMQNIDVTNYIGDVALELLGSLALALGVTLMTAADLVLNCAEALAAAIACKTHHEFGDIKVINDVTYVILAGMLSLFFSGKIEGVREGTILVAITCGKFVKLLSSRIKAPIVDWECGVARRH